MDYQSKSSVVQRVEPTTGFQVTWGAWTAKESINVLPSGRSSCCCQFHIECGTTLSLHPPCGSASGSLGSCRRRRRCCRRTELHVTKAPVHPHLSTLAEQLTPRKESPLHLQPVDTGIFVLCREVIFRSLCNLQDHVHILSPHGSRRYDLSLQRLFQARLQYQWSIRRGGQHDVFFRFPRYHRSFDLHRPLDTIAKARTWS